MSNPTGYPVPRERRHKAGYWRGKLTADQVLEIRRRYATGKEAQWRLAARFGVSEHTLSSIVNRITWNHLPE